MHAQQPHLGKAVFKEALLASLLLTTYLCIQINGSSSVLRCYNGMALAKMNRHEDAIKYLREAIKADPQNPLAHFELASVLVTAGQLDDALKELLILKVMTCDFLHFFSIVPPLAAA